MNAIAWHPRGEAAQEAVGAALARACSGRRVLVFLNGDLGAGKTTLTRGFIRALGLKGPVKSPTYTLIEPYDIDGKKVYHLDLYRLGDPEELEYLGLRELLDEDASVLIEWPERGTGWLPPADLVVRIAHRDHARAVEIEAHSEIGAEVLAELVDAPLEAL